jgi:histidine triad (HIT) family protein
MPEECLFCRIAGKKISAKIAAESEGSIVFYDINPKAPVHVLVVPKAHIENAMALQPGQAGALMDVFCLAQEVAKKEGIDKTGFRLVFNNGLDAGQAVSHLHLHVLGKRKLSWPPG